MIIAISGKMNSGKDEIGNIIRYLLYKERYKGVAHVVEYKYLSDLDKMVLDVKDGFIVKKFADKLKQIVCILLNCSREMLEKREFKNTALGEEWWYFKCLHPSELGSLVPYEGNISKINSQHWELIKLTPRLMLQLLGTEAGRNIIHPNIWLNALMSEYVYSHATSTFGRHPKYPDWIITDMRFPNELMAVNKFNAITIRVNSNFNYANAPALNEDNVKAPVVEHESETALDHENFKYTIQNNAGIAELVEAVTYILVQEKLITQ